MDLSYKQDVSVGGLVILAIVLFVVGTTWLSGKSVLGPRGDLWHIRFSDIGNLKQSSPVKVSGVSVGKVEQIRLEAPGKVLVGVSLADRIVPKTDARAEIVAVGFVGDAAIVLHPGKAPQPLPREQVIAGTQAVGLSDRAEQLSSRADSVLIGLEQVANKETADELRQTLRQLQKTMATADRAMQRVTDPKSGTVAELERTMASFRQLSTRLDSTLANPALARTLRRADSLTANVADLTEALGGASAQLDSLLAGVNAGRGTIGKFATDSGFYNDLRELSGSMKRLIGELEKNPGKLGVTVKVF
ncbi:MAG TPA: MlaD family protein [Gemmatimonadales bacterium]|nr:MlaD family protein [Gemmatimonadales bacterium]